MKVPYVLCLLWLVPVSAPLAKGSAYEPVVAFQAGPAGAENSGLLKYTDGFYYGLSKFGGSYGYGTLYRVSPSGEISVLVHFSGTVGTAKGRRPQGMLMDDGHGNLWGTTVQGGTGNFGDGFGTVFRFNPLTWDFTSVVSFTGTTGFAKGSFPQAGVQKDASGQIWGTTSSGGSAGQGTLFKIGASNLVFSSVLEFSGNGALNRGKAPSAGLSWDGVSSFYGSTSEGGINGLGTVFTFNPSSGILSTLVDFSGAAGSAPGNRPSGAVVRDGVGNWWGSTQSGGASGHGTVFRMGPAGGDFVSVASFTGTGGDLPGKSPASEFSLSPDGGGELWGVTSGGGGGDSGTIFKIDTKSLTVSPVAQFTGNSGSTPGQGPSGAFASDGSGGFWGVTSGDGAAALGGVYRVDQKTGLFSVIKNFTKTLGTASPSTLGTGLIAGPDGQLWGTSEKGGTGNFGTVYTVNPVTGFASTVIEFTGTSGPVRGRDPVAGLMLDSRGTLWGTTQGGGINNFGVVFKINALTKVYTPVVEFTGVDGRAPFGRLVADSAGMLWGTTSEGGVDSAGTIFKLNPLTGVHSPVVQFSGTTGGFLGDGPAAGLTAEAGGWFWGTTYEGGTLNLGTIFRFHPSTGVFQSMVSFTGSGGAFKGDGPAAPLTRDADGNFWGTTGFGGTDDLGTVFKINGLSQVFTTIAEFTGPTGDLAGANPASNLIQDPTGAWYGTTESGGAGGLGTLWRIAPDGSFSTLYEFTGVTGDVPGEKPGGMLFKHADGNFYGVTRVGGAIDSRTPAGNGQVFRLRLGPTQVVTVGAEPGEKGAKVNGSVNPNGCGSTVVFEYGTSPVLAGSGFSEAVPMEGGNQAGPVSVNLSGLQPSTRYYYRVRATNPENAKPQLGGILSFVTATPGGGGTGTGAGFVAWLNAAGLPGGVTEAGGDPDGDGLPSALEFALGGNPAQSDSVAMPWLEVTSTDLVFRFLRRDESETPDTHLMVEAGYGPASWVAGYDIGATAATSAAGVTVEENGTAPDLVTVRIPRSSGLKFARLKVVVSP